MARPIFRSGAALLVQFILLFGTILPVHSLDQLNITLNPIDPPPAQCEPFTFSWTGGTPPFFVDLIVQGGGLHLGPANDSFFTWSSPSFLANTVVQAMVWGSECGSISDTFVVQPGLDKESCIIIGPPDTTDSILYPSVGVGSSSLDSAPPGSTHISTSTARPSSQAAQSFATSSGLAPSTVPNTATTTATSSGGPAAVSNSTTSAPSASRPRLGTGAAAGIAAAMSAVATSLVLASFLYIKRRRRRAWAAAGADLSPARRGSRSRNSSAHGDTCTASSSDADRTHNGPDRSKSETEEDPEARTRANSSLVARTSSMDTSALDRVRDLSHQAHRESVNGVVEAEKHLREMRSLNRNVNGPGAGRNGYGQTETDAAVIQERRAPALEVEHRSLRRHETDGGVRLGGGRAGEVRRDLRGRQTVAMEWQLAAMTM